MPTSPTLTPRTGRCRRIDERAGVVLGNALGLQSCKRQLSGFEWFCRAIIKGSDVVLGVGVTNPPKLSKIEFTNPCETWMKRKQEAGSWRVDQDVETRPLLTRLSRCHRVSHAGDLSALMTPPRSDVLEGLKRVPIGQLRCR